MLVRILLALPFMCMGVGAARADTLALQGATLIDLTHFGQSRQDVPNATVVVRDGRIVAVGRQGKIRVPADAQRINLEGKWIVPGLIDGFSAQLDPGFAYANLAMGVTTISQTEDRDARRGPYVEASPQPNMRRLRAILGYSTPSDGARNYGELRARGRRLSDAELLAEIGAQASAGAAGLMLMYPLDDGQVRQAVAEARRRGLFTIGELGHASYQQAAASGVNSFIHTSRIELELAPADLRAAIADCPAPPAGDPLGASYGAFLAHLDTQSADFAAYARTLAASGSALMPTLSIATTYLPDTPNPWSSVVAPLIDPRRIVHLPFDRATGRAPVPDGAPADYVTVRQARAKKSLETMRAFHAAGVHFLAGSGATAFGVLPGWGLHRELHLLVEAGLTPREALAAATENFAEVYGWKDVGRIAPGYRADIVVLNADPTLDIDRAQQISATLLNGRVLDRGQLLRVAKGTLTLRVVARTTSGAR